MSLGPVEYVIICLILLSFLLVLIGVGLGIWYIVKKR